MKRKLISVSLSGKDLTKFDDITKYLKSKRIIPKEAEILKMALREYHEKIKKELGEALEKLRIIQKILST